tara:strand:+ start:1215 stop:1604 length:390 start_codon:yes stop_codon:yes gene_type:complete
MKIEEAKEAIARMLTDKYGSGSMDAVTALFKSLLDTGMGYESREDRRGGPIGCLDTGNMTALSMVLADRQATVELCHLIYYQRPYIADGEHPIDNKKLCDDCEATYWPIGEMAKVGTSYIGDCCRDEEE